MSTEIKVGIAFLTGIFLLTVSTFVVTDGSLPWKKTGPEHSVYFENIAGLAVGDPVQYGGFDVGEVVQIEVDPEASLAKVTYQVDPTQAKFVKIHNNSKHKIGADLFGRAALEITFGTADSGEIPKDTIPMGVRPTNMTQVLDSVGEVVEETKGLPTDVKELTQSLNVNQDKVLMAAYKILNENGPNIKKLIENVTDISTSISSAEGTVGKLIKDDGIYKKADTFMDEANKVGSELAEAGKQINEVLRENRRNIKEITDSLADASPNLERSIASIREILDENRGNVKQIINDVARITPKVNKSMYDINIITSQIAKGEGLIGKAIMDDAFMESVDDTIKKLGEASDELTTFASGANKLQTFLGLDWQTNTLDRESRAHLFLRIAPSTRKEYVLGGTFYINYEEPDPLLLLDWREATFSRMSFTFLLGWRFYHDRVAFRIGAIESVVGTNFEYSFIHYSLDPETSKPEKSSITSLFLELRALDKDFERPDPSAIGMGLDDEFAKWETEIMLKVLVRHNFGNGLILQMGGENLANTPRFLFGFVFEYMDEDIKYVAGTL